MMMIIMLMMMIMMTLITYYICRRRAPTAFVFAQLRRSLHSADQHLHYYIMILQYYITIFLKTILQYLLQASPNCILIRSTSVFSAHCRSTFTILHYDITIFVAGEPQLHSYLLNFGVLCTLLINIYNITLQYYDITLRYLLK